MLRRCRAGTFSSWISHGYVEERMKHLKFPMMLLTVFQFSSVAARRSPASARALERASTGLSLAIR